MTQAEFAGSYPALADKAGMTASIPVPAESKV